MRQEMEQVHQRIRAELTPEQQKEFEAMTKQFAPHGPPRNRPPAVRRPPRTMSRRRHQAERPAFERFYFSTSSARIFFRNSLVMEPTGRLPSTMVKP